MARIDKIEVVEKEILWADRKRILGMPISFTRYSMDEDRLYVKKGLLRMELNEILLYRILDVRSTQTLWQRIFGVGTLTLYSADQSCPQLLLKNIKRPEKLHRYLSDVIEKNRQSLREGASQDAFFGGAKKKPSESRGTEHMRQTILTVIKDKDRPQLAETFNRYRAEFGLFRNWSDEVVSKCYNEIVAQAGEVRE